MAALGQVERLTLEAQHVGDPALPHSSAPGPTWKPNPVALWVKPATAPTRVLLQGTPLSRGLYVLTGCRMTVLGVTWLQPWVPCKPSLGALRVPWSPPTGATASWFLQAGNGHETPRLLVPVSR